MLTALAVAASGVFLSPQTAHANEGSAPTPREYRVLETEHSDTIATFWDEGDFNLGAKADIDGDLGVRFPAEGILVHLNDLARDDSWPAGQEHVAEAGSTVWLAPQARKDGVVWPGFSTESVPTGVLNSNITFTLDSITGPGDVEVWTSDSFGGVQERLWSSDENVKSFSRPIGTHMHANWAFTAAGTYQFTVTASATTAEGAAVLDTKTYTFVTGPLAEQATTSTALHIEGESTVTEGTPIKFHATVTPASAEGYVEFRNGTTVLGHDEVENGEAELETTGLGIGTHSITAHFVPKIANHASASISDAVTVTVMNAEGVPFSIAGIQESYSPGDMLMVTLTGYTLGEGEQVRWRIRPIGSDSANGLTLTTAPSSTYSTVLDIADDGYEISAQVRQGSTAIATTGWVPLVVTSSAVALPTPVIGAATPLPMYNGDRMVLDYPPVQLAEGESAQLVFRTSSSRWSPVAANTRFANVTESAEQASFHVRNTGTFSFAVRVVKDGIGIRQSSAVTANVGFYEAHVENVQSLYRAGQTLTATGRYFPLRDGVDDVSYEWRWYAPDNTFIVLDAGLGTPPPVVRELTAADNGSRLYLTISRPNFNGSSSASARINVTDTAGQIFQFPPVSEHYHQNDNVDLRASIDPALSEDDTVEWEWKWPGGTWQPFPGMPRLGQQIKAEQAMDGVEVRATLRLADNTHEPMVAGPLTIHVDDHGGAARQQPTIAGPAEAVTVGDEVTLTRTLPSNGQTILTEHRWERLAAGAEEWTVITGESSAELSFPARTADDGAQYRVSIFKPTGQVAYGPSPAVTLAVEADNTPDPTVPAAPIRPGITVDGSTVSVTWLAPTDGGSVITGYTVTLTPASGASITQEIVADANSAMFADVPAGTWTATVAAINAIGSSEASRASESVTIAVPVAPVKDFTSVAVTISGNAKVGSTLTAKATATPTADKFSYQWLVDGKAVAGATRSTYVVAAGDAGKKLSVKVTASKSGYTAKTVTSTQVSVAKAAVKAFTKSSVTVSGKAQVAKTLTAKATFSPKADKVSYQWLRNGKAIKGATKSKYKVVAADAGKKLTVKATASKSGYATKSVTSKATAKVAKAKFAKVTTKVTGTAKVGKTLKVKVTVKPKASKVSYQWLRNGKAIKGATKASYKVKRADVGKKISVKVSVKKSGYSNKSVTSKRTKTIAR
ncbi:choice-of-anchor M domain-containing protein [Populibacterium corticicola]|uniref:choice-of-anchor M domain-containing protein n=1 Tax=Populibacterium corticicola TaxID=1812826 RepID=UPI00366B3793